MFNMTGVHTEIEAFGSLFPKEGCVCVCVCVCVCDVRVSDLTLFLRNFTFQSSDDSWRVVRSLSGKSDETSSTHQNKADFFCPSHFIFLLWLFKGKESMTCCFLLTYFTSIHLCKVNVALHFTLSLDKALYKEPRTFFSVFLETMFSLEPKCIGLPAHALLEISVSQSSEVFLCWHSMASRAHVSVRLGWYIEPQLYISVS